MVDAGFSNEVDFFRLYGKDLTEEPEILLLEYSQDALVAAAGEGHVHVRPTDYPVTYKCIDFFVLFNLCLY